MLQLRFGCRRSLTYIAYGTQTGTAREFALSLGTRLQSNSVSSLRDFKDPKSWLSQLCRTGEPLVLITACYGRGEPTDDAKKFYAFVTSPDAPTMKGLRFAVCGLGSSKTHSAFFNAIGKTLDRRLEELGGTRLVERQDCDDVGDIEEEFASFEERVVALLKDDPGALAPKAEEAPSASSAIPTSSASGASCGASTVPAAAAAAAAASAVETERALEALRLLPERSGEASKAKAAGLRPAAPASARPCFHLDIHLPEGVTYRAGDHIAVYPTQPDLVVRAAAAGIAGLSGARLAPGDPEYEVLAKVVDLCGPTSARMLKTLAARNGGVAPAPGYTIAETLCGLPPCSRPTLQDVLAMAPRVVPRQYSIASSPTGPRGPGSVSILFRAFSWIGSDGRLHHGLCSTWMSGLLPGSVIPISVRTSDFHLPSGPAASSTPVIFFAGGSGIAPFLGFLEERTQLIASGARLAPAILFYGAREDSDIAGRPEIERALANGSLTAAHLATGPINALPDAIASQAPLLRDLVKDGAVFLVCGGAKGFGQAMAKNAASLLANPQNFEKELLATGRYLEDVADV